MTVRKYWDDLRWLFAVGITASRLRAVLRDLSSRCLPPQMPGRVLMPDGFVAEIVTTQSYLRMDIGDEASEGKRRTYWIDRDTLNVKLPGELEAAFHCAEASLKSPACRRPLYVLKMLARWNPIVPSEHGVIDSENLGFVDCVYREMP